VIIDGFTIAYVELDLVNASRVSHRARKSHALIDFPGLFGIFSGCSVYRLMGMQS
jgi:hypothetical protein